MPGHVLGRIVLVLALLAVIWAQCPALIALSAAPAPGLLLAPAQATPGSVVLVAGRGFQAGEQVQLDLDGRRLARTTADAGGALPVTGIVVPSSAPPGTHRVEARGLRSGRVIAAVLVIVPLTPSVRVTSGIASPGSLVLVHGAGFLPREPIALALNGAGIGSSGGVAGLVAGPDGSFDAQLTAPDSMLAGANTISAIGSSSHVAALATLVARLPVRSNFFFAGASLAGDNRSRLAILNPGSLPATVRVTLFPAAGSPQQPSTVASVVAPASRADLDLKMVGWTGRPFGLRVQVDRRVAVSLVQSARRSGARTIPPVTAPRTRWLLAEGFTGLTFHESLALLNQGRHPVAVRVRLLLANGFAQRQLTLTVPAERQVTIDVSREVPRRAVSAAVLAAAPIVVSRTLRFGSSGSGLTTSPGSPLPSSTWLFAEGSTTGGYQTYLTVLDPGAEPAAVTASFYDSQGRPLGNRTMHIEAFHRGTLRLNDMLHASGFATFVTSSTPVVVERPLYLGDPNGPAASGTVVSGANGAVVAASFADGVTGPGTSERILLLNPTARTVHLVATLYPQAGVRGRTPVRMSLQIPPLARQTIDVGAVLAGQPAGTHGTVFASLNGVGFVAEQTIVSTAHGMRTVRGVQALAQ